MTTLLNKLILGTVFCLGFIATGCQSSSEKLENANEKVAEAREDLQDAKEDANKVAVQVANAEQWKEFRTETEIKIKNNEIRIGELRAKIKKPGTAMDAEYAKRIDTLEQKNKELKDRMDNYETNQSDWEAFKREFNHDMDELGQAMKDLTVDNKK